MSEKWLRSIVGLVFILVIAGVFRGCCVTFVDSYELGYRYDLRRGTTTVLNRSGYFLQPPVVVQIHTIDLCPMQVCITASGSTSGDDGVNGRVLNCKLVRFNPAGLTQFLALHGRDDYDHDKLAPLLRIYAYDDTRRVYPFLDVLRELRTQDPSAPATSAAPTPTLTGDAAVQ